MTRIYAPMEKRWPGQLDRDIDRLFGGDQPYDPDLIALVSLVSDIRDLRRVSLPDQFISDHAAVACSTVTNRGVDAANPGSHSPTGLFVLKLRRRLAGAAAGLAMFSGISGVALASNGAIPGDWNYPIDQALEAIGIGDGGADERLVEMNQLNEQGKSVEVLLWTASLFDSEADDSRGAALGDAADRIAVAKSDSGDSDEVKAQVAELLDYLSENKGTVDGQSVAAIAKDIGNGNGPPDNPPGNGNGNGPPDNPPGNGNGKKSP